MHAQDQDLLQSSQIKNKMRTNVHERTWTPIKAEKFTSYVASDSQAKTTTAFSPKALMLFLP